MARAATAQTVGTATISFSPATPVSMSDDPMAQPASVMVARYRSSRWYLDGTSLKVSRGGATGEEVINNVGAFSVTYLTRGGSTYSAAPTNWTNVTAVRVNMTLNGINTVDGNTITRNFSNVISLRSRNS